MIILQDVAHDMIANNLEPHIPTHPGEILKEEIGFRGISQRKLAAEMDVSYTQLNEVLNGKRPVNTELALLLEAALGLDAEPLLKMQARYNMFVAKRDNLFMEKVNKVRKMTALL
ncbi:addiction module HigA family antidote [Parabacteroides sp. PFB2-12]|uniref:HigA family addiction module antitoxin n=1 Tax=unclassified Parabacteroides TaxID=2649774 RepID=UPI002473109A|nr:MULTISPECIES: HigA family addiction module antitoxin [unclassified Parabacteroides]MDH6341548.1 addiction module HigA family antidote [Parabacteroides sp. PM6-13]MDH6390029.1 addiction module HigA family antidote [Parabacteroides sp. PFB2-12]